MASREMTSRNPARRVVITGMGVVAPNGCELPVFWDSILRGVSAAAPVTRFELGNMPTRISCELKDFNAKAYMDAKKTRRFDLAIQYGIAAARMAMTDSKLNFQLEDVDRVAIVEGTSVSGMEGSYKAQTAFQAKGYTGLSPFSLINAYCGGGSAETALELGIKGHAVTICTGSASGNDAIGHALRIIRENDADVVVAGGTEAPMLTPLFASFCHTKVMTTRNDDPQGAMRPLDKSRDGFLLGEGAAYVVLEELSHALGRGAKIYAELAGHGRSCEAYHSVAPHPDGLGMIRAMEKALFMAQMHSSEITYINVHGTATPANDVAEMKAVRTLFGASASTVAISSTKPVTGHLLGASGAMETVICALAIEKAIIPHTLNLKDVEAGCEGNLVTGRPRPYPVEAVMNLNCGFGGKNACLILKKYAGP